MLIYAHPYCRKISIHTRTHTPESIGSVGILDFPLSIWVCSVSKPKNNKLFCAATYERMPLNRNPRNHVFLQRPHRKMKILFLYRHSTFNRNKGHGTKDRNILCAHWCSECGMKCECHTQSTCIYLPHTRTYTCNSYTICDRRLAKSLVRINKKKSLYWDDTISQLVLWHPLKTKEPYSKWS